MDDTEIKEFLTKAEEEAKTVPERDVQLSRIREMWEQYKGEDRIVSSEEILASLENEVEQHKVMTGWKGIDDLTEGFTYEQLIVVSAQEKSGKTEWAIEFVEHNKDEEPCFFLFEQTPKEIIRQRNLRGQSIPHFVTPLSNIDNRFEWIEKRAMEAMVKKGSRLFVIDNVDWLQKEYSNRNMRSDEAITDILLKLKSFCMRWGVIVVLIAHVRKVPMEQIPQPDDIKSTSAFKQIADTVIILWRKVKKEKVTGTKTEAPKRTNETLVWVAENRRTGKTGYTQLVFTDNKYLEKVWDEYLQSAEEFETYEPRF